VREDLASDLLKQMGQRVPSKLIDFGRALDSWLSTGEFEWPYFLDKPYKWSAEYAAWANADYPQEHEVGWEEFMQAMDALVND